MIIYFAKLLLKININIKALVLIKNERIIYTELKKIQIENWGKYTLVSFLNYRITNPYYLGIT